VNEFGGEILLPDGRLDRAALAAIVFDKADAEKKKLATLGKITHKYVLDEARKIIRSADERGDKAIIVDAPALYESGFDSECDFVICLLADKKLRLNRISERDNISEERADQRISGQKEDSFYMSRADYTLTNDGDLDGMKASLHNILSDRGLI
jgi:dephospho-CoA kinase